MPVFTLHRQKAPEGVQHILCASTPTVFGSLPANLAVPPMGMHKEKPGPPVLWHAMSHLSLSLLFFHTVQVLWAYRATLHKTQGLIANGRGGVKETRVMARCRPHGCQPFPPVPKCWHCLNLQIGAVSSHGGRVRWYGDAPWCRDPSLGKLWPRHHCQPSYWAVSAGLGTARGSLEEQWRSPCSYGACLRDTVSDVTTPHSGGSAPLRGCCKMREGGQAGQLASMKPSTVLQGIGLWGPAITPTISITPFVNWYYNIRYK